MKRTEVKVNKFTTKMQKKLVILFIFVLLAFIGLSARLILINKEKGEKYKKQVLSQQSYASRVLPYKRGDILDAKGTAIAMSEKVYNVILDSTLILGKEGYLEPTIQAAVQGLKLEESMLREQIATNPASRYYVCAERLTYDEIKPFLDMQNDVETGANIQGIWFEEEYKRVYPYNSLASDTIGFTGKDNTGTYGLEEFYNDTLNGTNGREYGYLTEDSALKRTTKAAVDGSTIVTSLDVNIQSIVEEKILAFNEEQRDVAREGPGSTNTGVIVMDPNTGEIKAMASYPSFDLNDPKNLSAFYTEEQQAAMDADAQYEFLNGLWRNFCISDTFEPGSTAKPFTVAAGLETGKLSGNETYNCTGIMEVSGKKIRCHNRFGDGIVTLKKAVEISCNVAMMQSSAVIGIQEFSDYQKRFNFGLKTNIDLAGEARTDTLVYDPEKMVASDLAVSSFGQGYNVTMIEQAAAFSSLINGGIYYQPHVVNEIQNAQGAVIKNIEPRILKQPISAATSDIILDYCNGVVTEGTGVTARPAGYTMGGKTGTAEKAGRDKKNYVVSFIGYVPAKDPKVLIYAVIDEVNAEKQDQARYATLLVRAIMTEVLPYMNIMQTEPLSEDEQVEVDERRSAQAATVSANKAASLSANQAGSVSGNTAGSVSGNGADTEEDGGGESVSGNGEALGQTRSDVKIDEETGYAIDPITGELLDPVTGEPIFTSSSGLDGL